MKPQGRDYAKPRSFTSSPTQNRGAVRVRPGREIYRAPGVWEEAPQLNPSAQEFSPLSPAPLTSSRSMDWGPGFEDQHDNIKTEAFKFEEVCLLFWLASHLPGVLLRAQP